MSSSTRSLVFENGDKVEVTRNNDSSRWFSAVIVRSSPAKHKGKVFVEYANLTSGDFPLREYVSSGNVRPALPLDLHRYFKVGDSVDAFHVDAWRRGKIVGLLENSTYLVSLFGCSAAQQQDMEEEETPFQQCFLRLHRDWDDGSWFPPFQQQQQQQQLNPCSKPGDVKLIIKCGGKTSRVIFMKGASVEIRRDKHGYEGSWYTAIIVEVMEPERFMVQYKTLLAYNSTGLTKEIVDISNMRPSPPVTPPGQAYEELQEVDVWYADGWWVAIVIKVIDEFMYSVRLTSSCIEMMVEHSKLRLHHNWIDGKWVAASKKLSRSKVKCADRGLKLKIKLACRTEEPQFSNGMIVEVKSNEEGYQGSWYTAVIVGSMGKNMFLVEYQTLKTEDQSEPLQEKTDAFSIRPCPPDMKRLDRFKLFEKVDAWYNDGWWVGLVIRVLDGLKYAIYFWTTNEELELHHVHLRPHQELIGGRWVADFLKGPSEVPVVKTRPGNLKRQNGILKVGASYFPKGMNVEVTSDGSNFWYPAVVICPKDTGRFLVEYKTLRDDDEIQLLKEEADVSSMRPSPLVIQRTEPFELSELVDAWYNDMWCVGSICNVFQGANYAVRIRGGTGEVRDFQHFDLRPHRDWVNGKWVFPSMGLKM